LPDHHVSARGSPDYSRDILPILSENCFYCHGQDEKGRKAGLRLDVEADAKRIHDGVIAIMPGQQRQSHHQAHDLGMIPRS